MKKCEKGFPSIAAERQSQKREESIMKSYMCLGVRFEGSKKVYNYLSDDLTIKKGDYVIVSAPNDKVVQVVDVGFYTEEELPYPLGKLKKIKSLYNENNDRFLERLLEKDSDEGEIPLDNVVEAFRGLEKNECEDNSRDENLSKLSGYSSSGNSEIITMYTYCFVRFEQKGKIYSYISDNTDVEPGDFVQIERKHFPILLEVIDVAVCSEENAPYPPEQTIHVTKVFKKTEALPRKEVTPLDLIDDPSGARPDLFDFLRDYDVVPEQKCSEDRLIAFEKVNDTRFPIEYRRFLLEIGNGIQIPEPPSRTYDSNGYRYVVGLPKKLKKEPELSKSFLITDKYDETTKELYISSDCYQENPDTNCIDNICMCCSYRDICPLYMDEYSYEDAFFDGTCFLVSAGCTYSYHLIMNGPHRGEVWLADNGNYFVPISKSFSEFLKYLLTAEII